MTDAIVVVADDSEEPRRPPRHWHEVMHPEGAEGTIGSTSSAMAASSSRARTRSCWREASSTPTLFTLQAQAYLDP